MRATVLLLLSLNACAVSKPLGQVQFCLTAENGRSKLEAELRAIGRDEGLDYFDWSQETEKQLKSVSDQDGIIGQSYPILNVGIRRRDGLGFGGGNIGFPTDQVGFGFTVGKDRREALRLMRRVTARLDRIWDVHQVSGGDGMAPLICS